MTDLTATPTHAQQDHAEFYFTQLDACRLIGLGSTGPYFDPDVPGANWVHPIWREFLRRVDELPPEADRTSFVSPVHSRESDFTFYCGATVLEEPVAVPSGMISLYLPAHTYAVGHVEGTRARIETVYRQLPQWVAAQGRTVNSAILSLEVYPHGPNLAPNGIHNYDIYLPVLD